MKEAAPTPQGLTTPTVDFGPHAGEQIDEIPSIHLRDLLKSQSAKLNHSTLMAIRAELDRRHGGGGTRG